MKEKIKLGVAVVAAVLAAWFLWNKFFPNEEKRILEVLATVEENVSFQPQEGNFKHLAAAGTLARQFTTNAVIEGTAPLAGEFKFEGRDRVNELALQIRKALSTLKMELLDTRLEIAPDHSSATVKATAKLTIPDSKDPHVQDLRFTLIKVDGEWKISRLESLKTLQL